MKNFTLPLFVLASALSLAACNNPGQQCFGDGAGGAGGQGGSADGGVTSPQFCVDDSLAQDLWIYGGENTRMGGAKWDTTGLGWLMTKPLTAVIDQPFACMSGPDEWWLGNTSQLVVTTDTDQVTVHMRGGGASVRGGFYFCVESSSIQNDADLIEKLNLEPFPSHDGATPFMADVSGDNVRFDMVSNGRFGGCKKGSEQTLVLVLTLQQF